MGISIARGAGTQRWLLVVPIVLLIAWSIGTLLGSKDLTSTRAAVILSLLVLTSLVLFWAVSRSDPDPTRLFVLLMVSFALKLGAMAFRFYGGILADAFAYNAAGQAIAEQLARGQWPAEVGLFGTPFLRLAAGLAYYVTGVTFPGISMLWTWFGLIGLLLFYLAFRTAFPHGHRRLYMALILLFPSMLLWTSSLGKDALMVMFLGMGALGAARLSSRVEGIGVTWLLLGLAGMMMIRPHLAAVFAVAFGASMLIRPIRAGMMTPVLRVVGLLVVVGLAAAVVSTASGYVGLESIGSQEILGFIEEYQEQSARGGSAFEQVDPRTPAGAALAIPTVLFRPFPFEAHNLNARIASLEGLALLALMVFRWRSVAAALGAAPRRSYLLLIVVYALLFIFFFSAIANFGIIARQRAQLFPFIFMLVCYLGPRGPQADGTSGQT